MNKPSKYNAERNLMVHSNFSFDYISWEHWSSATVANSLFNGSIFENCIFENIAFNNADLEGTRFSNCKFIECSFQNADIRSIWIAKSDFSFVTFEGAMLSDSTFVECHFNNCGFDNLTQTKCSFDSCIFDSFQPQNSSITSSCYKNTSFNNAVFKNVFYYHRFENCHITNSTFEAYLLGFVYGISLEDLENCRITVMGETEYYISDCFSEFIQAVFSRIEQVYNDRKLFLNIGILELGDNTKSKDEVMLKCIELMHLLLKKNLMLKNEEITFFGSLVTYMYEVKEIAPITIFLMERKLSQIIEESSCTAISNTAWEKAKSDLNTLRNAAYFLFLEFTRTLDIRNIEEESITLQITYEEQPEIPLVEILSAMMPNYKKPIQIKTEKGSFIEYIEAMSASLPYIDVFLALIGVIVPIVSEVRATKRSKKEDPHPPSTESTNVIIPAIYLSPGITVNAQSEMVSAVKVIVEYNIVIDKQKKGYSHRHRSEYPHWYCVHLESHRENLYPCRKCYKSSLAKAFTHAAAP